MTAQRQCSRLDVVPPEPLPLRIRGPEHQAHPCAFEDAWPPILHSTDSLHRCRPARNPPFAVDPLDAIVRHGCSNHERETIAVSKRRQSAMERMAIEAACDGHVKRRAASRLDPPIRALARGMAAAPLSVADIPHRRLVPRLVRRPEPLRSPSWRNVESRKAPGGSRHALECAV